MAGLIGLIASIAGIIQLTGEVAVLTHGYIGAVKRAPQDISSLIDELGSLGKVLGTLKDYVETKPKSSAFLELNGPDGPLRGCACELQALQEKLVPREGLKGVLDSLKWPLKEAETKDYIAQFERHKTLFILALEVDHITLSKEIEAYVQSTTVLVQNIWAEAVDQKACLELFMDNTYNWLLEERRHWVLSWVSPNDFKRKVEDKHTETSGAREPGTGEWLLVTPEFQELAKQDQGPSLLWGFGIPGAGKTFLGSVVIDHFREEAATKNYGVAYMYFEYKERELQTPINILASLVRELTSQIPNLPETIEKLYGTLEPVGRRPKFEELYTVLAESFKSFDKVFLIFDALDECDPKSQWRDFLPLFHRMRESGASIFVTSRQYPEDIQESFHHVAKIELSPKGEDIEAYIRQRIGSDARAKRLVRQAKCEDRIASDIIDASQGMFLLAHFNVEYICQQPTAKKVLTALDRIKSSSTTDRPLDPTYDRVMETFRGQSQDCADLGLLVLSWLVKAKRTLTVEEIRVAVSIEADRYELDELDLPDKATILDVCAGLVVIDETSNTMKLAHYTVQEYLLGNSIVYEDSDFRLAMACTTFLTFNVFAEGPCTSESSLKSRLELHQFLLYAAHQLSYHLGACDEALTTEPILKFLQDPDNVLSYLQVLYYKPRGPYDARSKVGAFDGYPKGRSPILMASALGHLKAARSLLEQGADIASRDLDGHTPLHLAAAGGHEVLVKLLLENDADPCALDEQGETPLHDAANQGHENIVRLLLEKEVDFSIQGKGGQTALFQAAGAGHIGAVRLLLGKGADISVTDNYGNTPLHAAAVISDIDGWPILDPAVTQDQLELIDLLIEEGANVSARNKHGMTPLQGAVNAGRLEVTRLLLDKGSDVSITDNGGRQAIHFSSRSIIEIDQLLLDRGCDASAKDDIGRTPLHASAIRGAYWSVELLIGRGADISPREKEYGSTPLHLASKRGHCKVIQLLLDNGADIADTDNNGLSALHYAALNGNLGGVQFLVEKGADICALDKEGKTPLYYAAIKFDVYCWTQGRGIVINDRAMKGREDVTQFLLGNGADIPFDATEGEAIVEEVKSDKTGRLATILRTII